MSRDFDEMKSEVLAVIRKVFPSQQQRPKSQPSKAPDWSHVRSRYQAEVERHAKIRERMVSMAPQHMSITPVYLYQIPLNLTEQELCLPEEADMNLYAVKKQQQKIAALLLADKEASLSQANSVQRRNLIKKRIGDVSRQKKAGKSSTFQSSYEQNVHLYLRSLYNKKLRSEKAMVSRYHDQSEHRPYGKQQMRRFYNNNELGGGLPTITEAEHIRTQAIIKRMRRPSNKKTLLEQVELLNELKATSRKVSSFPCEGLPSPLAGYNIHKKALRISSNRRRFSLDRPWIIRQATLPFLAESLHNSSLYNDPPLSAPSEHIPIGLDEDGSYLNAEILSGLDTYRDTIREQGSDYSSSDGEGDSLASDDPCRELEFKPIQEELKARIAAFANRFAESGDRMRSFVSAASLANPAMVNARRSAYASGSMSGPLPLVAGGLESDLHNRPQTRPLTRPLSSVSVTQNGTPVNKTKRSQGKKMELFKTEESTERRISRSSPLTPVVSRRASSNLSISGENSWCNCSETERTVKVYNSCKLCYQTFKHAEWCENSSQRRTPRCETCGHVVQGLCTPSTPKHEDREPPFTPQKPPKLPATETDEADHNNNNNTRRQRRPRVSRRRSNNPTDAAGSSLGTIVDTTLSSQQNDLALNSEQDSSTKEQNQTTLNKDDNDHRCLGLVDPSIPIIKFNHGDTWHEDFDNYNRHTPTDSTITDSRVTSPDSLLDIINGKLNNGAYDIEYDFSAVHRVGSDFSCKSESGDSPQDNHTARLATSCGDEENRIVQPTPDIQDWSQVHKNAYLAALADARAKKLPLKPEYLSNRTTRSFTFTYYSSVPWAEVAIAEQQKPLPSKSSHKSTSKGTPMSRIIGKNKVYDYYPGGKKDAFKKPVAKE